MQLRFEAMGWVRVMAKVRVRVRLVFRIVRLSVKNTGIGGDCWVRIGPQVCRIRLQVQVRVKVWLGVGKRVKIQARQVQVGIW